MDWKNLGGLLQVFRVIGGGVLYLLIGGAALAEGEAAETRRLATGSLTFGVLLGFFLYYFWLAHQQNRTAICFLAIPAASLILAFVLNDIRKRMLLGSPGKSS